MSSYRIEFTNSAQKELKKLPPQIRLRIARAIDKLKVNPKLGKVRPMVGTKSWRLRVGDYRVVYDILDKKLLILIIRVRHRKDIYRH